MTKETTRGIKALTMVRSSTREGRPIVTYALLSRENALRVAGEIIKRAVIGKPYVDIYFHHGSTLVYSNARPGRKARKGPERASR